MYDNYVNDLNKMPIPTYSTHVIISFSFCGYKALISTQTQGLFIYIIRLTPLPRFTVLYYYTLYIFIYKPWYQNLIPPPMQGTMQWNDLCKPVFLKIVKPLLLMTQFCAAQGSFLFIISRKLSSDFSQICMGAMQNTGPV